MSEFDRAETFRRSIRRPRKPLAPQPPTSQNGNLNPPSDVSLLIKQLLVSKRDFVASPAPSTSPVIVSMSPKVRDDDDSSHSALMAIAKQINKIEFDSTTRNEEPTKAEIIQPNISARTKYDEMESLINTGISNDSVDQQIFRGAPGRSSGIAETKKIKQSRPVERTASDCGRQTDEVLRLKFNRKKIEDQKPAEHQVKLFKRSELSSFKRADKKASHVRKAR